jgi:hypothetical protein
MSIRSKAAVGLTVLICLQALLGEIGNAWQFVTSIGGIVLVGICIRNDTSMFGKSNFVMIFVMTILYVCGREYMEYDRFEWRVFCVTLLGGIISYYLIQILFRTEIKNMKATQ